MRRLRVVAIVVLSALAGSGAAALVATAPQATAAVMMVRAMLQVAAAAASDSAAISIVEPPFKPPTTWRYDPATLTVKVGTTVTWTNSGAVAHTVTADDGKAFDSGVMRPKATFNITLKSVGTFAYHCTYHRWMKGTIIAVP